MLGETYKYIYICISMYVYIYVYIHTHTDALKNLWWILSIKLGAVPQINPTKQERTKAMSKGLLINLNLIVSTSG